MKRSHKANPTLAPKKRASPLVNIATFKSHLSKYLRMVRSGQEVIVTDHRLPVARILPYETEISSPTLEIITAKRPFSELAHLKGVTPKNGPIDIVKILLEERGKR